MDDDANDDGFDVFAQKKPATVRSENIPKVEAVSKREEETKPVKKAINLFADDDDDDDFDALLTTPSTSGQQTAKSTKVKNLFDDDENDNHDDDCFLPPFEPVKEAKPSTSLNRPTFLNTQPKKDIFLCNLFDDEPPEDDFDMFKTKPSKNTEKPIKNIFGSSESIDETVQPKRTEIEPCVEKEPQKVIEESVTNIFDEPDISGEIEVRSSPEKSTKHDEPISVSVAESKPVPKAKPMISSMKPTSTQKALRLFDDPPPDDDKLFSNVATPVKKPISSAVQKMVIKQSGEFYNDFSETVTALEEKTKNMTISCNSLFVDEPPSDEELFLSKPKVEKIPDKGVKESMTSAVLNDSEKNQLEFSKKLSIFTNPSVSEDTQDVPKKPVIQPKKLNLLQVDINVSALLPGARRASEKTEKVDESMEVSSPESSTPSITTSNSHDNVDESGLLMNLNRDRAKLPSRRPSTRRGRQQQYQKSLDDNKTINEVESSDVVDECHAKSQNTEPEPPKVKPVTVESIEEDISKLELSDSPKIEEKGTIPSPTITVPSDPFVNQEQSLHPIEDPIVKDSENETITEVEIVPTNEEEIIPEMPEAKFEPIAEKEDPIDFPEMDFESPAKTKTSVSYDDFEDIAPAKPISKATPVFFDEIPPEDTFDHEAPDKAGEKSSNALLSKNALSLFGDDDDDEHHFEDQLFEATLPVTSNTQNEGKTHCIFPLVSSHITD